MKYANSWKYKNTRAHGASGGQTQAVHVHAHTLTHTAVRSHDSFTHTFLPNTMNSKSRALSVVLKPRRPIATSFPGAGKRAGAKWLGSRCRTREKKREKGRQWGEGERKWQKERARERKGGWGERKRGGLPLLSAKKSRSNHRECCRKEKKSLQVGREIRFAPQKLPGTEEFWLSKPTSPFKVDRL